MSADSNASPARNASAAVDGAGTNANGALETAVFGAGCFWCVEAAFLLLEGVQRAQSGYMGGSTPNPTYEQVCSGDSGHAEVVRVGYCPQRLSYADLLAWFFRLHDPTTLNRQGADVGTQYRSVIFVADEWQRTQAQEAIRLAAPNFSSPIVTTLEPLQTFYPAELDHHDFYRNNPGQPYCRFVIAPKLEELRRSL